MPPAIPLGILVRAAAALKTAKDAPTGSSLSVPTWNAVMVSHYELQGYLNVLLKDQTVSVAGPA